MSEKNYIVLFNPDEEEEAGRSKKKTHFCSDYFPDWDDYPEGTIIRCGVCRDVWKLNKKGYGVFRTHDIQRVISYGNDPERQLKN